MLSEDVYNANDFYRRESMKLTLAGEVAARDKPRKGGTLLCAKKPPRKKKGKKATSEAGYPLYSTSGGDGKCCWSKRGSLRFDNRPCLLDLPRYLTLKRKQCNKTCI